MASPQVEDGFTRVANEILEQTMKLNLNGTQFRIVMVIWRYTYGFQRSSHALSISFMAKAINASTSQVERNLKTLIDRKVVRVVGKGARGVNLLSFNKKHKEWDDLPPSEGKSSLPPNQGDVLPPTWGGELPSNQGDKKEKIKDKYKDNTRQNKYDEDNTYFKMAKYFHERVSVVANDAGISHLIKKSNMQTWADDMRKLVELDQVDKRLAKDVMDWVTEDSFWRTNVLSAKKLREKFMELAIKMNAEKKPVQPKQKPVHDPRDKEIAFQKWIAEGKNPDEFDWSR